MAKLTKKEMAKHLEVDVSTLYNWRKYKPNLYRIVLLGFKSDEIIERQRQNLAELMELANDEVLKMGGGGTKS